MNPMRRMPILRPCLAIALALLTVGPLHAAPDTPARPAEWAVPVDQALNLHRITPNFYRSARLADTDLPQLRTLGVRTVVSLRAFHSDEDLLDGSGIAATRVGMLTWSIDDDEVVAALHAIRQGLARGPVLLHCQHGADRTGLVSAMYRMVEQGWSREAAMDEMLNGEFGYHSMWKNIPAYLEQVDVASIRAKLDAMVIDAPLAAE